jgi:hypothetical protein
MCFCCKKNIEESTTEEDLENPKKIEEEKLKDIPFTKILAFEPKEAPKMIIATFFFVNCGWIISSVDGIIWGILSIICN